MNGFLPVGTVLTAFGLLSTVKQARYLGIALRSRHWQRTPGRVRSVEWLPVTYTAGRASEAGTVAHIRYSYTADGKPRVGYLVTYRGLAQGFASTARRQAAKYPVGQPVDVFVDPTDPDRAVLEPGPGVTSYLRLCIGLALLALGGLALYFGLAPA